MFASKKPQRSFRTKLAVEQFDARIVPAVVLTQLDLDGDGAADDIRIIGDGAKSTIIMQDDGATKVHIEIDGNSDGDYTDLGDLKKDFAFSKNSIVYDIQLKGGKDALGYVFTADLVAGSRSYNIDMGGGKDAILFQGGTVKGGSHVDMAVNAGAGDDTVAMGWDKVWDSSVYVQTWMGAGSDTLTMFTGEVDFISSMIVKNDLGSGKNTHNLNIKSVGYVNQADLDVAIMGGSGKDTVNVDVDSGVGGGAGQPSSHLGVVVDLAGGHDTFVGKLKGGSFILDNNSQASFLVKGGAGNDTLTMERNGSGILRVDDGAVCVIDLDGGAGKDIVTASFGGVDAWQLQSAFTSRLKIRLDGGAGNDAVACFLTNNASTKGDFDIAVYGGAGNDTLNFATNNNGGTPTYGPAGTVFVDGGLGKDSFANGNPALTVYTGLETVI